VLCTPRRRSAPWWLDQRDQLLWVHAEFGGEGERLGKALENEGNLQIHRELGGLALARFAHAENLFAHGCEQRIEALDDSFVSADHEDQSAISRADFRSGHGSVDIGHAPGSNALGKLYSGGGRNGAGIGDDHALGQRLLDAVGTKQYVLDRGSVGNTNQTTSAPCAAAAGVGAMPAPSTSLPGVRFQTVTSWPALTRFVAMACPIIPRPKKATRMLQFTSLKMLSCD
jgi:hypothetical protein